MGEEVVDLYGVLRMNASGWTASIKAAGAEAESMAGRTKAGFAALQKAGFLVASGLIAVGAASIKMAANFDAHMELIHTQAGASQAEVDQLKQHVLALAPITGQGPQALADGLYHIESAGFRGVTALSMLADAAKGAAIGNADLETVTQAMIGTMAVGFSDVHGSADAMAYLNKIVGIGDMRMEKLSQSIATGVLPSFKSAGLGMKDYGAALATLTDNVTPADEAATRLRMTVSLMAAPSGPAIKALAGIGIGSTQLANDLRKPNGLLVAVMDLKTHLERSGKSAAEQNQVIQKAFGGGRTSGAIMTLLEETDRLKSKYGELGTTSQRVDEYHKAFVATQQQLSQQWKQLTASVQVMGIELGNVLIPKLQAAATWLSQHSAVVKVLAYVLGGLLVAALMAATVAVVQFTIALLTNPLTWIVLGVELLIAAIYLLVTHWSTVWGFIKRITGDVAGAVVDAWHWVADHTVSAWHAVTGAVVDAWGATKSFLSRAWHDVADPVGRAWDAVKDATARGWRATVGFLNTAWHDVVDPITKAWHAVQSATTAAWGVIRGFFAKWWPLLLVIFAMPIAVLVALWNHFHQAIWNTSTATWGRVRAFLAAQWSTIRALAGVLWNAIRVAIINPIIWVWQRLVQLWGLIRAAASAAWGWLRAAAAAVWNAIRIAIINPIIWVWQRLVQLWGVIRSAAVSSWGAIRSAASTVWGAIRAAIINPVTSAWRSVTSLFGQIRSSVGSNMQGAWNDAKRIAGQFADVGRAIISGIVGGIQSAVGSLATAARNAAESALGAAKSFLGINSPSRVFANVVGRAIPEGIALGVNQHAHLAHRAVGELAGSLAGGGAPYAGGPGGPGLAAAAAAGGYGGVTVVNQITVQGSVIAERDLMDLVRSRTQQYARRNLGTGLAAVGR